jgi:AcrR family transcriptional regulator
MRERARAYQATRERIMQATFEMHRAKGVAATTISDVAARAGVAPATVLRHFPTMGNLITACGAHVWQWLELPDPKAVFRDAGTPSDRLRRLAGEVCGIYTRGEEPIDGGRRDRAAVPELDLFLRRLDGALEELVREGLGPLHPPEPSVRLALAVLDYGVWQSLRRRGVEQVTALSCLLQCVLDSCRQPEEGVRPKSPAGS